MVSIISKTATFRQLRALDMVSRHGSVSAAADELNLTQPAVSLQIGQLEAAVGAPLLRRTGRGVQLTAAGEIMARYAREILQLWSEAGEEVAALNGELGGTLRIGAITTAEYLIPPLLVRFAEMRPHVKTHFKVGKREDIVRMLATHEIDLAMMGTPPKELRIASVEFAKHPMVFVAAPGHPLARRKRVTLKDLAAANLLIRERGAGTRTTIEAMFKAAGYRLPIGSELSSNEAMKKIAEAGLGVAFVSLHACALELQAGLLRELSFPGSPIERAWYAVTLAERRLPQVAQLFRDFLVEHGPGVVDSATAIARRARRTTARGTGEYGA